MTEARAQDTNRPVRAQVLDAMREQFQDLVVGDGYSYDYHWCEIADTQTISEFEGFQHGNSILIFDQDEALETNLRSDLDESILKVDFEMLARDESGAKRYVVVARMMADAIKAFFAFREAQNGVLIGPARIVSRDWWDHGNGIFGVTCSAEIIIQNDDGDAYSLT